MNSVFLPWPLTCFFPHFSSNSRLKAPGTELFSCCWIASFWPSGMQIVICVGGSADCPAIPSSLWVVARYGLHVTKFGLPCGASSPAFPALLGELMWFYFAGLDVLQRKMQSPLKIACASEC
ncbi:hypothetical protein NC651_031123 [Populus alba x Populus x berolinensis]|nr:hypothetical protein NC651_031123 [Populus alba x Populus x berolinensis]